MSWREGRNRAAPISWTDGIGWAGLGPWFCQSPAQLDLLLLLCSLKKAVGSVGAWELMEQKGTLFPQPWGSFSQGPGCLCKAGCGKEAPCPPSPCWAAAPGARQCKRSPFLPLPVTSCPWRALGSAHGRPQSPAWPGMAALPGQQLLGGHQCHGSVPPHGSPLLHCASEWSVRTREQRGV